MKCIENISLEIKVFKSLFIQIIDGLNFGHIYDDYIAIRKCLSKFRRIFLKPRFLEGGGGLKKLAMENICNSVAFQLA